MIDTQYAFLPAVLPQIERGTQAMSFAMASDYQTGSLLRTLAASKPRGRFLELGTGTGLATSWLLAGMDRNSQLVSVDNEVPLLEVARRYLGDDPRVTFIVGDGAEYLHREDLPQFDLIFADTWPGKYEHLDRTLQLLKVGGFYLIDDMLPQPNWPGGHEENAAHLIADLENRPGLAVTKIGWSTGLMIVTKMS